jgi:hypothetical protein
MNSRTETEGKMIRFRNQWQGVRCFWICTTVKAAFGQKQLWFLGHLVELLAFRVKATAKSPTK